MTRTALAGFVAVIATVNFLVIGFAQDDAFRSVEAVDSMQLRYSALGDVIVRFAAEATVLQFVCAALPVILWLVWQRNRRSAAVAIGFFLTVEIAIAGWVWVVHSLSAMPFKAG